jgi:hypothetical protein
MSRNFIAIDFIIFPNLFNTTIAKTHDIKDAPIRNIQSWFPGQKLNFIFKTTTQNSDSFKIVGYTKFDDLDLWILTIDYPEAETTMKRKTDEENDEFPPKKPKLS